MKFLQFLTLIVCLITFESFAQKSPLFSVGSPLADKVSEKWQLLFESKKIGFLNSIGGKPRIIKVDQRLSPQAPPFFVIRYDAGAAGTRVISQLDRIVIVKQDKSRNQPQVVLDFPVQITRYEGPRIQMQIPREITWTKDNLTLELGNLDEFPKSRYVWKSGKFVKVE